MIELDERLRTELDLLVPLPDETGQSWEAVLRRAAPPRRRRRRRTLVLALAVAAAVGLAVSPVGGAIAREVGDFSAWLSGDPGEPASAEDQRAFEESNARSWAGFPAGTKLRRLISTEAAGGTFELFGFRTGDSLCLRLTVDGLKPGAPATSCAPLRELRSADAPVVAVLVDYGVGRQNVPANEDGFVPPQASASFGVVADGVEGVELGTDEGPAHALVAGNAFLAVTPNPPLGLRSHSLVAELEGGGHLLLRIAEAPFGNSFPAANPGEAPGPTEIERDVDGGTIGWLFRREPRGQSLAEAGFDRWGFPFTRRGDVLFARVVKPDPVGHARVAVGLVDVQRDPAWMLPRPTGEQFCSILSALPDVTLGSCGPVGALFAHKPITFSTSGGLGGSQYLVVHGLASDDVARIELFLGTGERLAVPLQDNAYVVEVARTKFPLRLVAYDAGGLVVATQPATDHLTRSGPRPVEGKMRVAKRVVAPNGRVTTLRTGPATEGRGCWELDFPGGGETGGCHQLEHTGPQLPLNASTSGVVSGTPAPDIATVELRFRNGERVRTEPVGGVVLHALTTAQLESGGLEVAIGLDDDGDEVGRQRFDAIG